MFAPRSARAETKLQTVNRGPKAGVSWCWSRAGLLPDAAGRRMANTLGERVRGETVGLRVRFGSKVSRKTRIECSPKAFFTRLLLDDPMLEGVGAVLFDEFHEPDPARARRRSAQSSVQ